MQSIARVKLTHNGNTVHAVLDPQVLIYANVLQNHKWINFYFM